MTVHDKRAVLFDLDGTLLDTAPDLAAAVNDLRIDAGLDAMPLSQLAPMCSFGARGMLGTGLDLHPQDADYAATHARFIARYRQRMTEQTRPFEGMREALQTIVDNGWLWGVVTNKAKELAQPIVDAMAFDPPPACVISASEVGVLKPDPACLLLACKQLQLDAAECIYVGDSERDMQAGNAAGMITIGVGFGYIPSGENHHDWPADQIVDTVAAMISTITARQTNEST